MGGSGTIGGAVSINGELDVNTNWTPSLGTGFVNGGSVTLFTYNSIAGSPDRTPAIDIARLGFTPSGPLSLTNTGSSIVLNRISVVPEPATVFQAGTGLGLVLLRIRRRTT